MNSRGRPPFDAIIVGSGPAGVSAAFPLVDAGMRVLMVDGGEVPAVTLPDADYLDSRANDRRQWEWLVGRDFQALREAAATSPKFRAPTLDYVFRGFAEANAIVAENFNPVGSLAVGGLSNAWGCGVARFSGADLADFPIAESELAPSFEAVARRIGISGRSDDDLADYFGVDAWAQPAIAARPVARTLLANYLATAIRWSPRDSGWAGRDWRSSPRTRERGGPVRAPGFVSGVARASRSIPRGTTCARSPRARTSDMSRDSSSIGWSRRTAAGMCAAGRHAAVRTRRERRVESSSRPGRSPPPGSSCARFRNCARRASSTCRWRRSRCGCRARSAPHAKAVPDSRSSRSRRTMRTSDRVAASCSRPRGCPSASSSATRPSRGGIRCGCSARCCRRWSSPTVFFLAICPTARCGTAAMGRSTSSAARNRRSPTPSPERARDSSAAFGAPAHGCCPGRSRRAQPAVMLITRARCRCAGRQAPARRPPPPRLPACAGVFVADAAAMPSLPAKSHTLALMACADRVGRAVVDPPFRRCRAVIRARRDVRLLRCGYSCGYSVGR